MRCSETARALTPRALASRTPCCLSDSRENWSVPAPIDWMKRSRFALVIVVPLHVHDLFVEVPDFHRIRQVWRASLLYKGEHSPAACPCSCAGTDRPC
jgi:hypothetical protein